MSARCERLACILILVIKLYCLILKLHNSTNDGYLLEFSAPDRRQLTMNYSKSFFLKNEFHNFRTSE